MTDARIGHHDSMRHLPKGHLPKGHLSKSHTKRLLWQGVAAASGTVAAMAVRRAAITTWRSTKHEDPPENPAARDVGWREALVWATAVAVGAAVARVVAQRGAAAAWERATGDPPPIAT